MTALESRRIPARTAAGLAGLAGFAALVALGAACSGGPSPVVTPSPSQSGEPATSAAGSAAAGPRSTKGDRCASGGPQVILAARVGIGLRDRAPETWVDFEVRGRELDAQRFCEAVVKRELAMVYPEESRLVARVERPCSATAMAEPKGTPPYLLAERRPIDGIESMMLGVPEGCSPGSAGVNATERRLTGYHDQASCERAQKLILDRRAQAADDAKAKAAEWLAGTIAEQEKRTAESCAAPKSVPCTQQKELVRLLKSRAAKMADDAPTENPGAVIGGPICRPR